MNDEIKRSPLGEKEGGHKVFVSGCYDLLHSGHIEFFRQAAQYGDLYVGIGSDATMSRNASSWCRAYATSRKPTSTRAAA